MCEDLANQHNNYESAGLASLRAGDAKGYNAYMDAADQAEDELDDHCMVID
jgi:hypothetical protein